MWSLFLNQKKSHASLSMGSASSSQLEFLEESAGNLKGKSVEALLKFVMRVPAGSGVSTGSLENSCPTHLENMRCERCMEGELPWLHMHTQTAYFFTFYIEYRSMQGSFETKKYTWQVLKSSLKTVSKNSMPCLHAAMLM